MADEENNQASGDAQPGSWSLHETIFKIVQDAQAAGSVIQIITIWPPASADGKTAPEMPPGCSPIDQPDCSPISLKDTVAQADCSPVAMEDAKKPKPPKK